MRKVVYVDEPPTMEVRKGLVHIRYEGVAEFVMSLFSFRSAVEAAEEMLSEWSAEQRPPIPFRPDKG